MKIIEKPAIQSILDKADPEILLHYIEQSFIDYSSGKAVVPPVGTLSFENPPGDVHIKYGYIKNEPIYVIKIASGFYNNPRLGIPSGNGLNLVFNQKNGLPEVLLLDEALLTDVRTALAGAVVAKYLGPETITKIGILGTGVQARLQLIYLKSLTDCRKIMVWGRNSKHTLRYAKEMEKEGFRLEITEDAGRISSTCNLIVTNTASQQAILPNKLPKDDVLITAVGADTIGKQELEIGILERADIIAVDSISQCKDHGEIHKAIRLNLIDERSIQEIGTIISGTDFQRPDGLIVADLTGIATQDIQISKFVLDHLHK